MSEYMIGIPNQIKFALNKTLLCASHTFNWALHMYVIVLYPFFKTL